MERFGTAAILAGGKSKRMGFDKQLLTRDGQRLAAQTISALRKLFGDILVITNTPQLYRDLPVRVGTDTFRGLGPMAGIHAALNQAQSEYVYVLACDMPIICPGYIAYQQELLSRQPAGACVTRKDNWIEPFNAFYRVDTLPLLTSQLAAGRSSLYNFLQSVESKVIDEAAARRFDPELRMYLNLNTPGEYAAFLGEEKAI